MKYLTLEHIRQHLRIDSVDEDAVLELYGSGAEDTILNLCNLTVDDLIADYGGIPDPIRQATLLLVGTSYQYREPSTPVNLAAVPYGTIDILLKPYMRLADVPGAHRHRTQTAVLGSDIKIEFSADLPDGLTMQEVDFTVTVYNETAINARRDYAKSECLLTDDGTYVVLVDTTELGVGLLMLRAVFQIPDSDYSGGTRKEVVRINPHVRVTG